MTNVTQFGPSVQDHYVPRFEETYEMPQPYYVTPPTSSQDMASGYCVGAHVNQNYLGSFGFDIFGDTHVGSSGVETFQTMGSGFGASQPQLSTPMVACASGVIGDHFSELQDSEDDQMNDEVEVAAQSREKRPTEVPWTFDK